MIRLFNAVSVLFLLHLSFNLNAQTTVSGKVVDASTQKILPYATVYFEGKKIGTKTDNFGNFKLTSPKKEAVIYAKYLGYDEKQIKLYGSTSGLTIPLEEARKKGKEVTIVATRNLKIKDTLALRIIRNVINNKDNNKPSAFESIVLREYQKFEVDLANIQNVLGKNFMTKSLNYMLDYKSTTPDGEEYSPFLFRETVERKFQKGKKKRVELEGVKDTKLFDNESIYSLINYTFDDYLIYDNQIIIANKGITSPLANSATTFYRYYVDDSMEVDGVKNYKLTFAPKSKEDFGFTGHLLIEEGSWAVKEADVYLDKRANFNYINHFAMSQGFTKVSGKWIMSHENKDIAMSITRSAKKFIKARFRLQSTYTDFVIDTPLSDQMFSTEEYFYLKNFDKQDSNFWKQNRTDTLTTFEKGIYTRSDTFMKSKEYQHLKYMIRVGTTAYFPVEPINWEIGRATQFLSRNLYEGWRLKLGMRTTYDTFRKFNVNMWLAYGFQDNQFKYGINTFFVLPSYNLRFHQITFTAFHDYDRLGEVQSAMGFDNTLLTVFRKPDNLLRDIVFKNNIAINWIKEWRKGEETLLGLQRIRYFANEKYQFIENTPTGTENKEYITVFKINSYYRYAFDEPVFKSRFNRIRLASNHPVIQFNSAIGLNNVWESQYAYWNLSAFIKQNIPYILGQFKYNVAMGKIIGKAPYIDIFQISGNQSLIKDNNRFYLMNEGEYIADQFFQVWLQQNFNGLILNKIPLIKKLKMRESFYLRSIIGSISDENKNFYNLPDGLSAPTQPYVETGFGLSNIFQMFEMMFMWRLTQHDKPDVRKFGVLFGFKVEI